MLLVLGNGVLYLKDLCFTLKTSEANYSKETTHGLILWMAVHSSETTGRPWDILLSTCRISISAHAGIRQARGDSLNLFEEVSSSIPEEFAVKYLNNDLKETKALLCGPANMLKLARHQQILELAVVQQEVELTCVNKCTHACTCVHMCTCTCTVHAYAYSAISCAIVNHIFY